MDQAKRTQISAFIFTLLDGLEVVRISLTTAVVEVHTPAELWVEPEAWNEGVAWPTVGGQAAHHLGTSRWSSQNPLAWSLYSLSYKKGVPVFNGAMFILWTLKRLQASIHNLIFLEIVLFIYWYQAGHVYCHCLYCGDFKEL